MSFIWYDKNLGINLAARLTFISEGASVVWSSDCLASKVTPESALLLSVISVTISQHSSLRQLSPTTRQPAICLSCTSWSDWKAGMKNRCLVVSWMSPNRPVTTSSQTLIPKWWGDNYQDISLFKVLSLVTGSCAFSHEVFKERRHPRWLALEGGGRALMDSRSVS